MEVTNAHHQSYDGHSGGLKVILWWSSWKGLVGAIILFHNSLLCPLYLTASLLDIKSCIFIAFLEYIKYITPFSLSTKRYSKKF